MKLTLSLLRSVAVAGIAAVLVLPAGAKPPEGKGNGGGGGGDTPDAPLPTYTWTALYSPAVPTFAAQMNSHGDAVGYYEVTLEEELHGFSTTYHGFLNVDDGAGNRIHIDLHDRLNAEGLITPLDLSGVGEIVEKAFGINESGQMIVILATYDSDGFVDRTSCLYSPEAIGPDGATIPPRLEVIVPGAGARALNDWGDVVASYDGVLVWSPDNPDNPMPLGTFDGMATVPSDINNGAQICGTAGIGGVALYGRTAWRYTPGTGFEPIFRRDPYEASVSEINDLGMVVGTYRKSINSSLQAFVYSDSGQTDLKYSGVSASRGLAVNNLGDVAGRAYFNDRWQPFVATDVHGFIAVMENSVDAPNILTNTAYIRTLTDSGAILMQTSIPEVAYVLTPVE